LALFAEETARLFRLSMGTVLRWEAEAGREPEKTTIGSLLKPTPPLRRYADVVHHLVQRMDRLGFGSAEKIAATLARAGWRLERARPSAATGTSRRSSRSLAELGPIGPPSP
jgi:hypothetical protein